MEERDLCNNRVAAAGAPSPSAPAGAIGGSDEELSAAEEARDMAPANGASDESTERWWCDDCSMVAEEPCLEAHPAQVLTTAAARATLLGRLTPAVKAARAANKKLATLQEAMDAFEGSVADRGPRLIASFDGWFDEWECGIMDGSAPIGLLTTEAALSAHQYEETLCRALTDLELTLDVERGELSGWCSLPRDLLDTCFPPRPPGLDLRQGAVLCDDEQITIYMGRCVAATGAGRRLLGYVERTGLRALAADRGPCLGQCSKPCVFCDDDIVIVIRRVRFDRKVKKSRGMCTTRTVEDK